ncbi:hypothetical protein Aple_026870 [Acrocarpospora pleiomorpha]|uniref:BRCT domain-containing protein n=1 Tax=Acrocarpospora pleiomorpha TaxID=90975 RepID=A0A5M3XJE7_9ACTN|nr:hypothetical protein Aple_026870 [Acrocarpospora pleiomorpha]
MADIPLVGHHNALIDAKAAAELLRYYLPLAGSTWNTALHDAAHAKWPSLPETDIPWVQRGVSAERDSHFLARLLDRLPRATDLTRADPYLALLDQVLLDHHISATEADALVEMATTLGLCRADVERLHKEYLTALGQAAHADGIVTDTERREITLVAELLDLPPATVRDALANPTEPSTPFTRFTLNPGDMVVFTGEMDGARETWEERARQASYIPHPNITKKVRLLIAADPDTLSGKARKARSYGIPIITPTAFAEILTRPANAPTP